MDESIQGLKYLGIAAIPKLVKDNLSSPIVCKKDQILAVNLTNKLKKVVSYLARHMQIPEVSSTKLVITSLIVCLILCSLFMINGQQFVYSILQREIPERERPIEEPGSNVNEVIESPAPFSRTSESGMEEPESGTSIGRVEASPIFGPGSGPLLRPGSEVPGGEINYPNVVPTSPIGHNATKHIVIPLPPRDTGNNILIGNEVVRSGPYVVERQPFVIPSQPGEQEVGTIPPPQPIYESPVPPSETNIILSSPASTPQSSVGQNDSQDSTSVSNNDMNTTTVADSQTQYLIPIANPGPNLTVHPSQKVILDGSKSYDPNGDPLYFLWLQLTGGPSVSLLNSTTPAPSFVAPAINNTTTLTFELLVGDGQRSSMPTYSYVTIEPQ